jgi:hypothetical protein
MDFLIAPSALDERGGRQPDILGMLFPEGSGAISPIVAQFQFQTQLGVGRGKVGLLYIR